MSELFLDSSAIFVWFDRSSPEGKVIGSFLDEKTIPLVTTNLVVAETLSLVTKRLGKHEGVLMGEKLFSSRIIDFVYVDETIQRAAWQLYKKYKDKDFDLVDATSFVVCQKRKIKEVLTLDRHFSQMGFKVRP